METLQVGGYPPAFTSLFVIFMVNLIRFHLTSDLLLPEDPPTPTPPEPVSRCVACPPHPLMLLLLSAFSGTVNMKGFSSVT